MKIEKMILEKIFKGFLRYEVPKSNKSTREYFGQDFSKDFKIYKKIYSTNKGDDVFNFA